MSELAGPLAVASLVLVAGGFAKLRDPRPTARMMAALARRPDDVPLAVARLAAAVELVLGVATFLVGGRVLGGLTAAAFGVFALVAWRLVRLGGQVSCGCFGRQSAGTTGVHVAVDVAVALLAAVAAAVDAPGFLGARPDLPAGGVPFVAFAVLGAWFTVAALTVLPDALLAARRGPRAPAVRTFEVTGGP